MSKAIAEAENVAIETVLSSDKFIPVVRAARRRGYLTRLIYIGLPSVELAIERVAGGGHDVPKAKIRSRWSRTHAMFALIRDEVDDVIVFSNRELTPMLVGERMGAGARFKLFQPDELPEITRIVGLAT